MLLELTDTTMDTSKPTTIPMDAFGANLHYNEHFKVNYTPMDTSGANLQTMNTSRSTTPQWTLWELTKQQWMHKADKHNG